MNRFELEFIPESSCFKVTLVGAAFAEVLIQIRSEIQERTDQMEEFSILVDLRESDVSEFREADISRFQASAFRARAKRFAVVTLDDLQYGLARQFFGHADSGQDYELLITKDEFRAQAFVDLSQ